VKNIILSIWFLLFPFIINAQSQKGSIKVFGSCEMCKDRIEHAAINVIGVSSATWDQETKLLSYEADASLFQIKELHLAVAAVGHDTELVTAKNEVYNSLPMCCNWRKTEPSISGFVYEVNSKSGKKEKIIGVNIYWLDQIVGTATDTSGSFILPMSSTSKKLVISYIGYTNDTLEISKAGHVAIVLNAGNVLGTVIVNGRRASTSIDYINPIKTQQISSKELMKAACCNLSESFETNPTVDISYTDAVTGTRKIEMLGLSGPNVQITRELIPDVRGLNAITGFGFTPGPWLESLQLSHGVGSVLSGFESIAGQINVEIKKPNAKEKVFLNGYANNQGRYEANAITGTRVNKDWQSNLLLHYANNSGRQDRNLDGFMDMPNGVNLIAANTWMMNKANGNEGMVSVKVVDSKTEAGQDHQIFDHSKGAIWALQQNIRRYEVNAKRGKVFLDQPYKSIGFQFGAVHHKGDHVFGQTPYDNKQKSVYANLLYSTIINDTDNKILMGASFVGDRVDERVFNKTYERREYVPGLFAEMTNLHNEKLSTVLGLRVDRHNNFGVFVTPRFHLRYAIRELDILRLSAGRGQRTANIFSENIGAFASSRRWEIQSQNTNTPYGLQAERAWNFGLSYNKSWATTKGDITWGVDLFHTRFNNQVVVDFDKNPQTLVISNLDGVSRSNSFQTQLDFTFKSGLDIRAAYRYVDVKSQFATGFLEKPLLSPHRAFLNVAYQTQNGWNFDYTYNLQSSKRLPSTRANPEQYRRPDRSPSFAISNAQVSKVIGKLDLYLGGENLLDFRQLDPIIDAQNPYSRYFDSSMTWGPVFGRIIYVGVRYSVDKEE
jgi:outer membrane receptor for ferrienterochelin and colicins